jgi:hypothetical protein
MRVKVRSDALEIATPEDCSQQLTPNTEYFVIGVHEEFIRVINDNGEPILYAKILFTVSDCLIPPGWQFVEGTESDYYLAPQKTGLPGFYEDYFCSDGDIQAEANAQRTLREVLREAHEWGREADRLVIARDLMRQNAAIARPRHRRPPPRT